MGHPLHPVPSAWHVEVLFSPYLAQQAGPPHRTFSPVLLANVHRPLGNASAPSVSSLHRDLTTGLICLWIFLPPCTADLFSVSAGAPVFL